MNWLISANSKIYDHASSFAHFGSIDWRQGNAKYSIGDFVYIYCTAPIQRIRYKCKITALNKKSFEIRNDKDYWHIQDEYEKSLNGMFFNLQLIEEADTAKLSIEELKLNGLLAPPQGPIKLKEQLEKYITSIFSTANDDGFPETLSSTDEIYEGIKRQVTVNKYERSSIARDKCISIHGYRCKVCDFDFEKTYGILGKNFIHVHHIVPIHTVARSYKIDYENDLVPVCPNCHAMLHKKSNGDFYSISELKEILNKQKNN
jgi:5-methylcytosine-specific restriction protein A